MRTTRISIPATQLKYLHEYLYGLYRELRVDLWRWRPQMLLRKV